MSDKIEKKDEIRILAEPQMDPNVCEFIIDRVVYDGLVNCTTSDMAKGSPLLEGLFTVAGVDRVMIAGANITIGKTGSDEWADMAGKIGDVIRAKIQAGGTLISEDINKEQPTNKGLWSKVQDVIDAEINPGLASHGGGVVIRDVKGTVLFLTMSGGCQGCASASQTLSYGIKQILTEKVPEVTEIVDVTDHMAGANPYYS